MKKKNKYQYLYVLQGNYGYGHGFGESYREVKENFKAYRINEGGNYRIIKRREINK